jgi:hypothetical protein
MTRSFEYAKLDGRAVERTMARIKAKPHSKYTSQELATIVAKLPELILEHRGSLIDVATSLGMPRRSLIALRTSYPAVDDAIKEGDELLADKVERQLLEVALAPKEWRGINVTAGIFSLKALRGSRWNPPNKVELDDSGYRPPAEEEKERDTGARLTVVNGTHGKDDGG